MYIGIDPGLTGAIAKVSGEEIEVWDMPTLEIRKKRFLNATLLAEMLSSIKYGRLVHELREFDGKSTLKKCEVLLERVSARPGQGVTSMFSFGTSYGIIQGIIATLGFPLTFVTPQEWRKKMGVPKGKDGSRQRILELRPDLASKFSRKKDHGRADAVLLALYGGK
jgi:crossover junction endodeoxyribonuclease RuvC